MRRNGPEIGKVALGTAGLAALIGAAIYLGSHDSQPSQLHEPTPIPGPAIPGAAAEQDKSSGQILLERMITENPHLQQWRNELEKVRGAVVHVDVYRSTQIGFVSSPIGVNVRKAPDKDANIVREAMPQGTRIESRIIIFISSLTKDGVWAEVREVGSEPSSVPQFSVANPLDREGRTIRFLDTGDREFERFIWDKDGSLVKF